MRKHTEPRPLSAAERQQTYRDSGRQISVVLRDPHALAELERLERLHGGTRAAIEAALRG